MGKLDDLKRMGAANVAESMGARQGLPPGINPADAVGIAPEAQGVTRDKAAVRIEIGRLVRDPSQPRQEFDEEELRLLSESLRKHGQLQPILVRFDKAQSTYVVIAGERRLRAANMAGLKSMACVIDNRGLDEGAIFELQLIENALRSDLTPVEQAKAYKAVMERRGWSGVQLAAELSIAQSSVSRALTLLDLPASVQAIVDDGTLNQSAALAIAKIPEPEIQEEVAQAVVQTKMKRSDVQDLVSAITSRRPVAEVSKLEPLTFNVGKGVTVTVKWGRGAEEVDAATALRRATRQNNDRERAESAA